MKYFWIQGQEEEYPVGRMCEVLGVSKSGFYAWRDRPESGRKKRREELAGKIRSVQSRHRGVYGSPRVVRVLRGEGEKVCENTVARIMREEGLGARRKRRFVPRTTDSRHEHRMAPNVLDRLFQTDRPNRKWAADITYISTKEGWLYLAGVIDLCSRKIVGWSMADHMRTDLVADALDMAIVRRDPPRGLLHHSDRGVQYACDDYQELLQKHGIECSMSGKGNCYDNAVMESFWATLKVELLYPREDQSREEARAAIFEYIEVFYNRQRLHSSIGYLSPEMFEAGLN